MSSPIYYFKVVLPDEYFSSQPDSQENLNFTKNNKTVNVEGVSRPLKHGDVFTAQGQHAVRLKYLSDSNQLPFTLETIEIPDVQNFTIDADSYDLNVTWTANNDYSTLIQTKIDGDWEFARLLPPGINATTININEPDIIDVKIQHVDEMNNTSRYSSEDTIEIPSQTHRIKDPGVQGYSLEQLAGGLQLGQANSTAFNVSYVEEDGYFITVITTPTFPDLNGMYYFMATFDLANPILFADEVPLRDLRQKLRFVTPDYLAAESSTEIISELTLYKGNNGNEQIVFITSTFNAAPKFLYGGLGSLEVPSPFFDPVGVEPIP